MGTLSYAGDTTVEFDDRTLAHLQVVIGAKLRRGESFYFSWRSPDGGRITVWLHPTLSLRYNYMTNQMPSLNRVWLEQLTETANNASGLQLIDETKAAASVPAH